MEESDDISALEKLLAEENSDNESPPIESKPSKGIVLTDFLSKNIDTEEKIVSRDGIPSSIHKGDTDSSDDEHERNCFERQYDSHALELKKLLEKDAQSSFDERTPVNRSLFRSKSKVDPEGKSSIPPTRNEDVYADPVFGIRISNPLISGSAMSERMRGREAVPMHRIKYYTKNIPTKDADWVVGGAVVRKSAPKESQKGSLYSIWTLSDLKGDLKTVSVFLFKNAHKQLWKTTEGTVVGILNPNVLDSADDSQHEACLSVDNPDRVMIMGRSKDLGFCASRKKNGDPCTSFVNKNQCQYCIYHVKQEYNKCSKRSDLQASFSGRGLQNLRNKVLGKDTVIYGGKSYTASPPLKNSKTVAKDKQRLLTLSGNRNLLSNPVSVRPQKKRLASQIDVDRAQRAKDMKRLQLLGGGAFKETNPLRIITDDANSNKPIVHHTDTDPSDRLPTFSLKKDTAVDLHVSYSDKQKRRAKATALNWIKLNGPIDKSNPNKLRGTSEGKKRLLDSLPKKETDENVPKKTKLETASDRFKEMLERRSAHSDLINEHDDSEREKYFKKLEMKESMEEKMLNTFKVPCKGVRCMKCSYTNFSAAERCKLEKHPLKVFDTFKRFFKCGHCNNRTTTLEMFPLNSCNNCHNSKWQRAAMINERKTLATETLSIRGDEEKFLGSHLNGSNINLLVPDN